MSLRKAALYILCLSIGFVSCKKNDTPSITVEVRDRAEQQIIDNDSIIGYLETHYYNSGTFVAYPGSGLDSLVISELPESGVLPDPDKNTLLKNAVETKTTTFADTDYEFYILKLNQGGGDSPTFADKIRANYEGSLLDDRVFDSAINPVDFDLLSRVPGWSKAIPNFSTAESFVDAGDGTVDYFNYGVGVMFLPSGLGYFSTPTSIIASYSPIIFKFELLQMEQNDHDGDGVPSYLEDLDGDGEFTFTGDNTDADNLPDFADNDDDNDGILTANEIVITTYNEATKEAVKNISLAANEVLIKIIEETDGTYTGISVTFTDTDGDGTPDYLDKD